MGDQSTAIAVPVSMADNRVKSQSYDSDGSDRTSMTDQDQAKADATIPITLVLKHAYIYKRIPDSGLIQMLHDTKDAKRICRTPFALPEAITYAELTRLLGAQAQAHYDIDLKAYNPENGGRGTVVSVECEIDIEGAGEGKGWMLVTVPNEEAWKAAKGLMRVAKGKTEVSFMFAVKDNKFLNAFLMGCVMQ